MTKFYDVVATADVFMATYMASASAKEPYYLHSIFVPALLIVLYSFSASALTMKVSPSSNFRYQARHQNITSQTLVKVR